MHISVPMKDPNSAMSTTDLPSLVIFGSLTRWPAQEHILQLQQEFRRRASLFMPLGEAARDLEALWYRLTDQDEALMAVEGRTAARTLAALFSDTPYDEPLCDEGRNALLLPFAVLSQISQYLGYLERSRLENSHGSVLKSTISAGGGIQGFCAGLLSAQAVASATSLEDVVDLSCTSLRLAFCAGVYVDSAQMNIHTTNLAVRCKVAQDMEGLRDVVESIPETYIAVTSDKRAVTITTPTSSKDSLQKQLLRLGHSFLDIGLDGKYHNKEHADAPINIIRACKDRLDPRFGSHELVRSNLDGAIIPQRSAVSKTLESILVQHANWQVTFSASTETLPDKSLIISIGQDAAMTQLGATTHRIVKLKTLALTNELPKPPVEQSGDALDPILKEYPENAVAVIGMACKFPGADSIDEFWDVLRGGKSMLEEIPKKRFDKEQLSRSPPGQHFWGNFVRDIAAFDHKFFKKSAREAASMDPQQRLLLQVAYHALESSGYFSSDPSVRSHNIGCYIGSCATDYDGNIGSHPPGAYSTTGTLRAFLSGRISHYFGLSGPSLVFDTACSSSAVAIHAACQALLSGECSQAIAGGVTLITSPYLYENLSAAHFLSPSGATKPFDAAADGYCRGEGVGLVVLKKLSNALRDGDNVTGIIAGSAVNQNANCVSITVPHSDSQSTLYRRVVSQAGIDPQTIAFVEAHGTGTPVGDPIEMESIRHVFGGPSRREDLLVSSVKGNIGHLEAASGVAALIKAILQMENRTVCLQASFKQLNPKIPPLEADRIRIPTVNTALPLQAQLSACINNYGAAGSNVALILLEPPTKRRQRIEGRLSRHAQQSPSSGLIEKLPIQITAASQASLLHYGQILDAFIEKSKTCFLRGHLKTADFLRALAFSLARQQNQAHPYMLTMTLSSTNVEEFQRVLKQAFSATEGGVVGRPHQLPLILCFGGQTRQYVGLSKHVWETFWLFRFHLDACDVELISQGYPSIYPAVFQATPIDDITILHSAIFATQYACAQSWRDSGLQVDGIIGHSLGQLAALCVSGILSLQDGLKLVAARASLIKEHWGAEAGTMISIEAEVAVAHDLMKEITDANPCCEYEIACYNGPTSQVVVSDETSADRLEEELLKRKMRYKRLNVTHGFHSRFVDPLMPHLEKLVTSLTLNKALLSLETCIDGASWHENPTAALIAAHTRDPVYFGQAVERLQRRLGACTFLEVGSDSSVTSMARRASLESVSKSSYFVPMDLGRETAVDHVIDTTVKLWNYGHRFQFWDFHPLFAQGRYGFLRVPSYCFETPRHWLALKTGAIVATAGQVATSQPQPPVLLQLIVAESGCYKFKIDPTCGEYSTVVNGYVVEGQGECPSSFYVDLILKAMRSVEISAQDGNIDLALRDLHVGTPLGLSIDRSITLQIQKSANEEWEVQLASKCINAPSRGEETLHVHATASVFRVSDRKRARNELARFQRLARPDTFLAIAEDPASALVRGAMVYKVISPAIDYADMYCNVKTVASRGSHFVGMVQVKSDGAGKPAEEPLRITQPHVLDSFFQVSFLHSNHMSDITLDDGGLRRFSSIELVQLNPDYRLNESKNHWDVFGVLSNTQGEEVTYDIFIYDRAVQVLVLLLLGVRYSKSGRASQSHVPVTSGQGNAVSSFSSDASPAKSTYSPVAVTSSDMVPSNNNFTSSLVPDTRSSQTQSPRGLRKSRKEAIWDDICALLESVAEVKKEDIKGNSYLEDLGVDSLMMIEIISEISGLYGVELEVDDLVQLTDFESLIRYLYKLGCGSGGDDNLEEDVLSDKTSTFESSQDDASENILPSTINLTPTSTASKPVTLKHDMGLEAPSIFGSHSRGPEAMAGCSRSSIQPAGTDNTHTAGEAASFWPQLAFDAIRFDFDKYAEQTGFNDFWARVYPDQAKLVEAYILDAFRELGCDLATLASGCELPSLPILPQHTMLVSQLHRILAEGGIVAQKADGVYCRTRQKIDTTPSTVLYHNMLAKHPEHASETSLLNVTASSLSKCLTGKTDPLQLLFANKANKSIMADVYENAPMCRATTMLLANYLSRAYSGRTLKIIEVGAGTGGTAKYTVDFLAQRGIDFEYVFTDISASLVKQATKLFVGRDMVKFATLDCTTAPPPDLRGTADVVIATNCIHATSNAATASSHVAELLRPDGVFCLVEFTRGLYWFDLVYGLLGGWWAFSDDRTHALGDQHFWDRTLRGAGFKHVAWTGPEGTSPEAQTMRLICAFRTAARLNKLDVPMPSTVTKRAGRAVETFVWKRVGSLDLKADVYYPKTPDRVGIRRPIALMIHGGGHLLFGRRDIPMNHVRVLLKRGFLPVSVDYRFCPELTLFDGPVSDCRDALRWARETLPFLPLSEDSVTVDPSRLLALGWSSGGHLAMTLGHTAEPEGIKAPDLILPFYSPSDLEDEFWTKPNYPDAAEEELAEIWGERDCVLDEPIAEYTAQHQKRATTALSLTLKDDRERLILHMNWNAQSIPVLIGGLPPKSRVPEGDGITDFKNLPMPPAEQIRTCSPYWHILQGTYRTPTFMVHGDNDDWLPWQMTEKTIGALQARGIPCGMLIPKRCGHAFDLFPRGPRGDPLGVGWAAIEGAYDWACERLQMENWINA